MSLLCENRPMTLTGSASDQLAAQFDQRLVISIWLIKRLISSSNTATWSSE